MFSILILFAAFVSIKWTLLGYVANICHPHDWTSETLHNDQGDQITYLYCQKCQVLAGQDCKRESEGNIKDYSE